MNANILRALKALGIKETDTLHVHSSYKSLGSRARSLHDVISTLMEAVGAGTLCMPSLTYINVNREQPVFDVRSTPSCVGAVSECFRTNFAQQRSLHPTHSFCAVGDKAGYLLNDHHLDHTPCGPHSPLRRLMECGGKILMLGCTLAPNTSMHAIEELVQPDYLFKPEPYTYTVVDEQGKQTSKSYRQHGFDRVRQVYERLEEYPELYTKGNVLDATCYVLETRPLWDFVYAKLKQDEHFFVRPK